MEERSCRSTRFKPALASIELSFATTEAAPPPCDHPGCMAAGTHRAPRSRWPEQHGYYAFCLEHVRVYNENWDYYAGMSPAEIEASRRDDVTWNRPSWHFGGGRDGDAGWQNAALKTAFERVFGKSFFDDATTHNGHRRGDARTPADIRLAAEIRAALETLDMTIAAGPVSFAAIKQAYKRLAKQHHPDLCQSDPTAEDRLKAVNQAYALLKQHADLFPDAEPAGR